MNTHASDAAARQRFYDKLAPERLSPLWEVMKGLVPPEPRNKAVPHAWAYAAVRPLLLEAGNLLTAEEAERRVLVFENPSFVGTSRVNSTLYAGMQLILPGETAPAHKHAAGALRFILESEGGYTTVAGERAPMARGDVVITPSGAFHDHGHDGDAPVIWIDGLDVPIVNFFEAGFSEELADARQPVTRADGHSLATFGSGMLPLQHTSPFGASSPVFSYPYARAREAVVAMGRSQEPDPWFGHALRYANPLDGGWVMPTMAAWLAHLPGGFATAPYKATDNAVMVVAEGRVSARVGDRSFDLGPNDVITLPGWTERTLLATGDTILFFFSDRSAQEKLGIWKERR